MSRVLVSLVLIWFLSLSMSAYANPPIKLQSLLRSELALDDNIEVIVSLVEIASNQSLPSHYHPGEEFVYILEGSAILRQKNKPDTKMKAGEVYRIPYEQVHTAITEDKAVKAIVFRVHEKARSERYPANE